MGFSTCTVNFLKRLKLILLSSCLCRQARWIEGWSVIGAASRLVIPLGLHTKSRPRTMHAFLPPSESGYTLSSLLFSRTLMQGSTERSDDAGKAEGLNLIWTLLFVDTFAAAASVGARIWWQ